MKLKIGNIANPFSVFALIWVISLCIYLLGWSSVFPVLSTPLFLYLVTAIVLTFFAGILLIKIDFVKYIPTTLHSEQKLKALVIFNIICWLLNFAYSGIPLISVLSGADIDIHEFGIPTFKVFILSFNSFLCVYLLHHYLTTKKRQYLLFYLLGIFFFAMIFSRGLIMMTLVSSLFLWLMNKKYINVYKVLGVTTLVLIVLYMFGVAGNVRTAKVQTMVDGLDREYSSDMILQIGGATDDFKSNLVPNEFFWGYLYIASPISNLQYNLDKSKTQITPENIVAFGVNELTFDFIAKRLIDVFNVKKLDYYLIVPELSVCTTFTGSYRYLGWLGLSTFLILILLLPVIYFLCLGKTNTILPVALCIFSSIYFFSFFDNMFIYSGLGLQILYPLIFKYFKIS